MDEKKMTGKKQSMLRTWFQVAWFVMTNGYIRGFTKGKIFSGNTKVLCFPGLNCYSCPGALAACPMGALQAVMGDASYRISLYVFGFLAALGVLFGRLVCGWMCPFGLFQDLLYKIPLTKKIKNLPGHKYLKYLRYVILIVFPILLVSIVTDLTGTSAPWFCEWICPSGMLFGGIPLVSVNEGLREAAGGRFIWKLIVLIVITLMSVKVYRPFCKYLCPLGAIYGLFNPISTYRLVIDKDKCVSCGMCRKACGMDINTYETPNSMDCIRCGSCITACPKGAISSTWSKKREQIRSRCFAEDDTVTRSSFEVSTPIRRKATFLGVMTILTGLVSIYANFKLGLEYALDMRMTVEAYADVVPLYLVFHTLMVVAAVLFLMTGIYILRGRRQSGTLILAAEKAVTVLVIEIIGFLIGGIGCLIDKANIGMCMTTVLYCETFVAGVPVFCIMSILLKKLVKAEENAGGKKSGLRFFFGLLSVIYVILLLVTPILILAMSMA